MISDYILSMYIAYVVCEYNGIWNVTLRRLVSPSSRNGNIPENVIGGYDSGNSAGYRSSIPDPVDESDKYMTKKDVYSQILLYGVFI